MVLQDLATMVGGPKRLHKGNKWSTKEIVDFIIEIYEIPDFSMKNIFAFLNSTGVILDSIRSFLKFWHFQYQFFIKRFLINFQKSCQNWKLGSPAYYTYSARILVKPVNWRNFPTNFQVKGIFWQGAIMEKLLILMFVSIYACLLANSTFFRC